MAKLTNRLSQAVRSVRSRIAARRNQPAVAPSTAALPQSTASPTASSAQSPVTPNAAAGMPTPAATSGASSTATVTATPVPSSAAPQPPAPGPATSPAGPPPTPGATNVTVTGPSAGTPSSPSATSPGEEARTSLAALIGQTNGLAGDPTLPEKERDDWHRVTNQLIATQTALVPAPAATQTGRGRRRWPWALIIGGGLVSLLAMVLRTWGVVVGVVYGPDPIRYIDGILVAGVLAVVAGVIARQANRRKAVAENLAQVLALVSALVTAIALAGIFVPTVPGSSGDSDCPRARTHGAAFVSSAAATINGGVNARAEPRRSGLQVARYPTDCLIGFDGFCLGEPVTDATYGSDLPRKDARWLRIARHENSVLHFLAKIISGEPDHASYIAAGVMQAQSLADLKSLQFKCEKDDPAVTSLDLTVDKKTHDVTGVVTTENDAEDVQFVVYVAGPTSSGGSYRQVPAGENQTMVWKAGRTAGSLVNNQSTVVVAAVPCIAPSIPPFLTGTTKTQVVTLSGDGSVTLTDEAVPGGFNPDLAADEACKAIE